MRLAQRHGDEMSEPFELTEELLRELSAMTGQGLGPDMAAVLSVSRQCRDEGFVALVEQLLARLPAPANKASLGALLSNLLAHALMGRPTRIPLDASHAAYVKRRRDLNPYGVTYDPLRGCLKGLVEAELVAVTHKPSQGLNGQPGRQTRIEGTANLRQLLREHGCYSWPALNGSTIKHPPVILRDKDGASKTVLGSAKAAKIGRGVQAYNDALLKSEVELPDPGLLPGVDWSTRTFHRVFNGSWKGGGRFYGAVWQSLDKQRRALIRINGEAVLEPDYRAMHVYLLYHLAGARLQDHFKNGLDPYLLPGFSAEDREALKLSFLFAINCTSKAQASRALRKHLPKLKSSIDPKDAMALLRQFGAEHAAVAPLLFRGMWAPLHHLESSISEKVISEALLRGIVPLNVHDSFLVRESEAEEVVTLMEEVPLSLGLGSIPVRPEG